MAKILSYWEVKFLQKAILNVLKMLYQSTCFDLTNMNESIKNISKLPLQKLIMITGHIMDRIFLI